MKYNIHNYSFVTLPKKDPFLYRGSQSHNHLMRTGYSYGGRASFIPMKAAQRYMKPKKLGFTGLKLSQSFAMLQHCGLKAWCYLEGPEDFALLHHHVSTVAKNEQNKLWLLRESP